MPAFPINSYISITTQTRSVTNFSKWSSITSDKILPGESKNFEIGANGASVEPAENYLIPTVLYVGHPNFSGSSSTEAYIPFAIFELKWEHAPDPFA